MSRARDHDANNGLFRDLSFDLVAEEYIHFVQDYPSVMPDIGGVVNELSLAYHFLMQGFDRAQPFAS